MRSQVSVLREFREHCRRTHLARNYSLNSQSQVFLLTLAGAPFLSKLFCMIQDAIFKPNMISLHMHALFLNKKVRSYVRLSACGSVRDTVSTQTHARTSSSNTQPELHVTFNLTHGSFRMKGDIFYFSSLEQQ